MDSETIYGVVGVGVFALIAYFTLRKNDISEAQTKEEKRFQILNQFKDELRRELDKLDSKEEKATKKVELLKKFSDELSRNIFFDEIEIKEIILDIIEEY
jgi:peptidoglycan hydrolase CwlO-like protein